MFFQYNLSFISLSFQTYFSAIEDWYPLILAAPTTTVGTGTTSSNSLQNFQQVSYLIYAKCTFSTKLMCLDIPVEELPSIHTEDPDKNLKAKLSSIPILDSVQTTNKMLKQQQPTKETQSTLSNDFLNVTITHDNSLHNDTAENHTKPKTENVSRRNIAQEVDPQLSITASQSDSIATYRNEMDPREFAQDSSAPVVELKNGSRLTMGEKANGKVQNKSHIPDYSEEKRNSSNPIHTSATKPNLPNSKSTTASLLMKHLDDFF